ncbi:MAG: SRPBCC family protein [Actinomycetota bacterium]
MKIDNEFSVSVPIELAWPALTDLAEVSLCLPGARLTGVENDVYSGEVRVKVGPVVSEYGGTAQFAEKDDAIYRAVIDAKGRDSRGAGNASAQITMQLEADGLRTVVKVDTDLKITGKIAQLGGGMIAEVSQKLLGQFVECLEAKLAAPLSAEPSDVAAGSELSPDETTAAEERGNGPTRPVREAFSPPDPRPAPEPVDLISLAGGSMLKRLVPVLLVVVVVLVVVYLIAR